jgi:hypothetical protein
MPRRQVMLEIRAMPSVRARHLEYRGAEPDPGHSPKILKGTSTAGQLPRLHIRRQSRIGASSGFGRPGPPSRSFSNLFFALRAFASRRLAFDASSRF